MVLLTGGLEVSFSVFISLPIVPLFKLAIMTLFSIFVLIQRH